MTEKRQQKISQNVSMMNDNADSLGHKHTFFLPKFAKHSTIYYLIYVGLWVVFSNIFFISSHQSVGVFFFEMIKEYVFFALTVLPSLFILDTYRPYLRTLPIWQVCMLVILLFVMTSLIAMVVVATMLVLSLGEFDIGLLAYDTLINSISISVLIMFMLMYYLYRYARLLELEKSFELRLASQNELFNARMSPHFFFNTINGLTSLVETDPKRAVSMLADISTLFRASFDNTEEISMDQEVELCQVFLHIDEMRFQGKLDITWELPDEDLMYDMVITGLTLQRVLEKLLHRVVELTTESIAVTIRIGWEHHQVTIEIIIKLPLKTLLIKHDLVTQINFDIQERRLKSYFGEESAITGKVHKNNIQVVIHYPLHDPGAIEFDNSNSDDNTPFVHYEK